MVFVEEVRSYDLVPKALEKGSILPTTKLALDSARTGMMKL